uniref:Uncharacterized protein n=1 Tax=Ixodes ricinus TaxID=34613 RepID=A0A6B0TU58_IXORI
MYRRRDYRQEICPCLGCGPSGEHDHLKSHPDASISFCKLCFLGFHGQATYLHHVSVGLAACGVAGCPLRGTCSLLE